MPSKTNELYKQLRAATVTKDDAAVYSILSQIVAIDPTDADAVSRLATMKKSRAASTPQKKTESITKELYKKYRSACLAHDDNYAYSLLEEILRLAPGDLEAEQQKQSLGKRIASSLASTLTETVNAGDVEGIAKE